MKHNVEFMIDNSIRGNFEHCKSHIDGMTRTGTKPFYYFGDELKIKGTKDIYEYKINRFVYVNKTDRDFHKIILWAERKNGEKLPLLYCQYYFDTVEHPVNHDTPKERTRVSNGTRERLKNLSEQGMRGKELFSTAVTMAESFEDAKSVADIPNISQIYKVPPEGEEHHNLVKVLDSSNRQKTSRNPFERKTTC